MQSMTWSIAHELTFPQQNNYTAASNHDAGGPWKYHFETFLPAHGWTVTVGEDGGLTNSATVDRWYGLEKTNTYATGETIDMKLVLQLQYDSHGDIHAYSWDGSTGSGGGSLEYQSTTNTGWPSVSYDINYKWFVSDEHTDAWMLIVSPDSNSYEPGLHALSLPTDGYIVPTSDNHFWKPLGAFVDAQNMEGTPYIGTFSAFQGPVRYFNPNWCMSQSNSYALGFNQLTDIMVKVDAVTTSYTNIEVQGPSSLLIGSDYWLDLKPISAISMCIKTGATDFGVLQ